MNSINFKTEYPDVVKEKLDEILKKKLLNDFQESIIWFVRENPGDIDSTSGITVYLPHYCGIEFAFYLGRLVENIESGKMIKMMSEK